MRSRARAIHAFVALSILVGALAAQEITTWSPVERTVRYGFRIMNPTSEPATGVEVYVPLPLESPRQQIHYLRHPERGLQRTFRDVHGQRLLHYSFDRIEAGEQVDLGFVAGVTLKNLHWSVPEQPALDPSVALSPEERERYLTAETNYSMDSGMMIRAAHELTRGAASDYEKLVRIHDHVTERVRYVRDDRWDPAAVVLARGTGSCSEYNYALSGLCRLAGLPTRCVGGSTNGFRDLPTTDGVYHRWTEVFLDGLGWFPADCSRDSNPIRGNRSHFGRVHVDVLVWCRQAGGEEDSLGWDYRAKARVRGEDPGLRWDHRTRWFRYRPERQIEAARAWLLGGAGPPPGPDPLECALLRWEEAPVEGRLEAVRALARAGRAVSLRWAAALPEAQGLREACLGELCSSPELAGEILERSRELYRFRSWFRSNESRLVQTRDGRFALSRARAARRETPVTAAPAAQIWAELAADAAGRLGAALDTRERPAVYVAPVVDQTLAGLDGQDGPIRSALDRIVSEAPDLELVDAADFEDSMRERGPGPGEYWALATADRSAGGWDWLPRVIAVPVCITERTGERGGAALYHLELKVLELERARYFSVRASARRQPEVEPPADRGVLVAAGDTVLARWEHDMVGIHGYDWPLAGVEPVLAAADAALCNLECCVSLSGEPVDKGERCSFYYRARPEMLRCLTRAGIDVVCAANNHAGDYGPVSVADTAAWCAQAGLVCVGNGGDEAEAEEPRVVRVGPVLVGIAGMDATTPCFRAGEGRPGTSYADEEDLEAFAEKMRRLGRWAEGRCDLLVLTLHWGGNWVRETRPAHREMARIAFESGVDLVLGHSAHRLQGIEVIDGKVAVYDMGNLLFDCKLRPEGELSAIFRLQLSPRGVHRVEVVPTLALNGHTVLAGCEEARECLAELSELCSALGTELGIDEDLEGRPMGVIEVPEPRVSPRARPGPEAAGATLPLRGERIPLSVPDDALAAEIPEDASPIQPPAALASGVELLASRLPPTAEEGGILNIHTWWRVSGPVGRYAMPAFHIETAGETPRRGLPWYTRHDAADWTVPLHRLEPGDVVEDRYPARLQGLPAGICSVWAVVIDTTLPEGERVLGEPCLLGRVAIRPADDR